jgi:hypothetical protein
MARRKDIEITGREAATNPNGASKPAQAKSELPTVESPPLSPGTEMPAIAVDTPEPAVEPVAAQAPAIEPIAVAAPASAPETDATPARTTPPRFVLKARHKRYALLAASVTFAAALGAVLGALANSGFSAPARPDVAAIEENKAMQQSIARLGKEITTLKASLEQANKSAHTQIAKISERLEHAAAEVTGSVSAPRIAAVEPPPARPSVVAGWTIRDTRNGYVYVESRGEVYQVVLGAPLPGLGPVQSVKRQDGRWVVLTPKGIIVSMRDRRYFGDF